MKREEYKQLVKSLEPFAQRNPGGYRTRVALLAFLGYAYILLILLVLVGLLIGLIVLAKNSDRINTGEIKIGFALLVIIGVILRSMWVSFPRPDGTELTRDNCPKLFEMVDELVAKLQAVRFNHVLLTDEFNAAAAQRPRMGIFGWQENYLLLGLPLMLALTPGQFRAVVAHELGHLSGNHGRFGGWIYRINRTWEQLVTQMTASRSWLTGIFTKFFEWYMPYFEAYSFVLRRQQEYEADRASAELAGARNAAEALSGLPVKARQFGMHWSRIFKQSQTLAVPPASAFSSMSFSGSAVTRDEAIKWFRAEFKQRTDYDDTHPALVDRLRGLGFETGAEPPPDLEEAALKNPEESAAQHFLGAALPGLIAELDRKWVEETSEDWQQAHEAAKEARGKLIALQETASSRSLTEAEEIERGALVRGLDGAEEALPELRRLVELYPQNPQVNYLLGTALLETDDEAGIGLIEKCMAAAPESMVDGCKEIYDYLKQQGRHDEADQYRARAEGRIDQLQAAFAERFNINKSNRFEPHDLPTESVEKLRAQLSPLDDVSEVYVGRKVVKIMPERPFYVIAVVPKVSTLKFRSGDADAKLQQQLSEVVEIDQDHFALVSHGETAWLAKSLKSIPSSQILTKK